MSDLPGMTILVDETSWPSATFQSWEWPSSVWHLGRFLEAAFLPQTVDYGVSWQEYRLSVLIKSIQLIKTI